MNVKQVAVLLRTRIREPFKNYLADFVLKKQLFSTASLSEFNPGLEGVLTAGCPCATAASTSKPHQAPSKAPT